MDPLVSKWMRALDDPDGDVRSHAAHALGQVGDLDGKAAVPSLLQALQDEDLDVRNAAAHALGMLHKVAQDAALPLVRALLDSTTHKAALEALDKFHRWPADAIPALVDALLGQGSSFARRRGAPLLAKAGRDAVPYVLEALASEAPTTREAAAHALGVMGKDAREASPSLWTMAKLEEEPSVRIQALWALAKVGQPADEIVALLLAELDRPQMKGLVFSALEDIGAGAREAVPLLEELLCDESHQNKSRYAAVLGHIGGPAILPLLRALGSSDPQLRRSAAAALGECVGQSKDVTPALVEALDDEDGFVRLYAAESLVRWKYPAEKLLPFLLDALTGALGSGAARILCSLKEKAAQIAPVVVDAMCQHRHSVSWSQRYKQLVHIGAPAVAPLLRHLSEPRKRYWTSSALAAIGEPAIAPLLEVLASDEAHQVRVGAAHALLQVAQQAAFSHSYPSRMDSFRLRHRALAPAFPKPSLPEPLLKGSAALLGALSDPSAEVRAYAAFVLAHMERDEDALLPALAEALCATHKHTRMQAASALGALNRPEAVPLLVEALSDAWGEVSEAAAYGLALLGARAREAVPALVETLSRGPRKAQIAAAIALGNIARKAKEKVPALVEALFHPNLEVSVQASHGLSRIRGLDGIYWSALRERLSQEPSRTGFLQIVRLLYAWNEPEPLDLALQYAQKHLASWPDGCRHIDSSEVWPNCPEASVMPAYCLVRSLYVESLKDCNPDAVPLPPERIEALFRSPHLKPLSTLVLSAYFEDSEAPDLLVEYPQIEKKVVWGLWSS